jgi:Tol biopolymer transport system component
MTRAGKQLVRVTRVGGDGEPRWSPNGREIAFVRQPRCFWEPDCAAPAHLYLVRPDGRGLRRVWSGPNAFTLLWSPDSRSILFTADRSTEDATRLEIELVRADSRGGRTLSSGGVATAEAWSRDGRKILFARDQTPQQGGSDLWVMDVDGGRPTRLLSRPGWTVLSADWGA